MPGKSLKVGKVLVKVRDGEKLYYLFSKKNAPGSEKHKRLELLGGNIEEEDAVEGTIRELEEEETTGFLAGRLSQQHPARRIEIDGRRHYIFDISIELDEYKVLEHNHESLGFELIPASRLNNKKFQQSLTKKTRKIFEALDA